MKHQSCKFVALSGTVPFAVRVALFLIYIGQANGRSMKSFRVQVTITSLAPAAGTCITPAWFGIHDGSFDLYDRNVALPSFLEPLVEDGNNGPLVSIFPGTDGQVGSMPLCPSETATGAVDVDVVSGTELYFSYATMILPSNDAFLANGDPMMHKIFDNNGKFVPVSFVIAGSAALDGGTEMNDESTTTTAFFGQTTPNTGTTTTGGVVTLHPGFIKPSGPILSSTRFAGADFTTAGYEFVRVAVTAVPLVERTGVIRVANTAPTMGTCLTPVWVGIHGGQFDTYNRDQPLPAFMEPLVEDGNIAPLADAFNMGGTNFWDATVGATPLCPGESAELTFSAMVPINVPLYFSYATMILPSNDAFLSNGNPTMHLVFNNRGRLQEQTIVTTGAMVLDGGTEDNDELPANTAFFGQMAPNTGTTTPGGVVTLHPGFRTTGGGILADPRFAAANFKAPGYQTMTISVMSSLPRCNFFTFWLQSLGYLFGFQLCQS